MAGRTTKQQKSEPYDARTTAFLLTQVGSHAGSRFAAQVMQLGITTAQVGILLSLSADDGISQAALARRLGVVAARTVVLVDDLEAQGLVSRSKADRRTYAVSLTERGRSAVEAITQAARHHDQTYFGALSDEEKSTLRTLLEKIANGHGLSPNSPACKPVFITPLKRTRLNEVDSTGR